VSFVAASLDGPEGGSARVGAHIYSVPWLGNAFGRIGVHDRSGGANLVLRYIGTPEVDGNTISGVARGLTRVREFPFFAPVEISWSFTDND
jgi:hypothetical protein